MIFFNVKSCVHKKMQLILWPGFYCIHYFFAQTVEQQVREEFHQKSFDIQENMQWRSEESLTSIKVFLSLRSLLFSSEFSSIVVWDTFIANCLKNYLNRTYLSSGIPRHNPPKLQSIKNKQNYTFCITQPANYNPISSNFPLLSKM